MKRLLLLHGYGQNSQIFYKKTSAIRKQCKDCEFVYADAPHVLLPADLPQNLGTIGATSATPIEVEPSDPEVILRGWWKKGDPESMQRYIEFLRDLLHQQQQPFDGVFGFSQGACAAALLAALLERPQDVPGFQIDGRAPHPPLKFCIAVAGFRPSGTVEIDALMERGIEKTPVLHVLGINDQIIPSERTQTLIAACKVSRVEKHEGGHFVPSKATWRQFFTKYLAADDYNSVDVPSPNPLLTNA